MPIFEFECPIHGRFEKLMLISQSNINIIPCEVIVRKKVYSTYEDSEVFCTAPCKKVWSLTGNIQIGAPTKIFVNNKTGEIFTPFSKHDKPPNGYHEKELKSPIERSKFEKEQQRRADAENQLTSHVLDSMKSEARKNRHDNLKAKMNAIQREEVERPDGKKETIEFTLDHRDKSLLNKAMQRSNKKPKKEKKTDVKFAINHYNPSNMDQVK